MKVTLFLACTCTILATKEISGKVIRAPLDIISLDDITPEERKQIYEFEQKLGRPKRSGSGAGSGDIFASIGAAIGQGIKKKIGQIAQGSASASAHFSKGSSSGSSGGYDHGYHSYDHHPPESYDHKSVDVWGLKKSILNTLLQAVKAIKGGVIAVKGQLIKGSGHLITAKGKLISAKGEAITNLGKNIATSAILVPYHGSSGHEDYGPPSGAHYSAPSAPEDIYHGSPSAPGPEFHEPEHYPYHRDDKHQTAGLLILKKIPGSHHQYHHHEPEESKVPPFKPIAPSGPSFGSIIGKFFSASSSLDPHKPDPFGNSASGAAHYETHPYHAESHHHEVEPSHHEDNHNINPSASGYVVHNPKVEEEPSEEKEPTAPSTFGFLGTFEKEPHYLNQNFDEYTPSASKKIPQSLIPQKEPSLSPNFDDHIPSASKKNPQAVKANSVLDQNREKFTKNPNIDLDLSKPSTPTQNSFKYTPTDIHTEPQQKPSAPLQSFAQNAYPLASYQTLGNPSSTGISFLEYEGNSNAFAGNLPNIAEFPNGFPPRPGDISHEINYSGEQQQVNYNGELPASALDPTASVEPNLFYQNSNNQQSVNLVDYPNNGEQFSNFMNHQIYPNELPPSPQKPHSSSKPYLHSTRYTRVRPTSHAIHESSRPTRVSSTHHSTSSSKQKHKSSSHKHTTSSKRPTRTRTSHTHVHKPKPPNYDVVKSVAYEIGPDGPKRLT